MNVRINVLAVAVVFLAIFAQRSYTATAQIASWVNPDGGFCETANNWAPNNVSGLSANLHFKQSATYLVVKQSQI